MTMNATKAEVLTEDPTMKAMVDRFLNWKLPQSFQPDCGISFNPHPGTWPIGTNVFTATEARQMLEHVVGAELTSLRASRDDEQQRKDEFGKRIIELAVARASSLAEIKRLEGELASRPALVKAAEMARDWCNHKRIIAVIREKYNIPDTQNCEKFIYDKLDAALAQVSAPAPEGSVTIKTTPVPKWAQDRIDHALKHGTDGVNSGPKEYHGAVHPVVQATMNEDLPTKMKKAHDLLDAAKVAMPDGTHSGLLHRLTLLIAERDELRSANEKLVVAVETFLRDAHGWEFKGGTRSSKKMKQALRDALPRTRVASEILEGLTELHNTVVGASVQMTCPECGCGPKPCLCDLQAAKKIGSTPAITAGPDAAVTLTTRDFRTVEDLLKSPPPPNDALKQAFEDYRVKVAPGAEKVGAREQYEGVRVFIVEAGSYRLWTGSKLFAFYDGGKPIEVKSDGLLGLENVDTELHGPERLAVIEKALKLKPDLFGDPKPIPASERIHELEERVSELEGELQDSRRDTQTARLFLGSIKLYAENALAALDASKDQELERRKSNA